MITYQREQQQTIPDSEVIIVGVGGAGGNMLDRVALDGMEEAQQLALNTDSRTLASTVAAQKVQMGMKLTRGLGCGGDPELGLKAALEVESLPSPFEFIHIGAELPHGVYPMDKAKRLLGWEATDFFEDLYSR